MCTVEWLVPILRREHDQVDAHVGPIAAVRLWYRLATRCRNISGPALKVGFGSVVSPLISVPINPYGARAPGCLHLCCRPCVASTAYGLATFFWRSMPSAVPLRSRASSLCTFSLQGACFCTSPDRSAFLSVGCATPAFFARSHLPLLCSADKAGSEWRQGLTRPEGYGLRNLGFSLSLGPKR